MKCPFTQEDVNSIDPKSLAITFNNSQKNNPKCGHESFLPSLVSYLHGLDNSMDTNRTCPCCCERITDIYDGVSNDIVLSKSDSPDHDVISFKYGHFVYHLSVCRNEESDSSIFRRFRRRGIIHLAQVRIAEVLDIDLKQLKILHRGKVMSPNKDKNMTAQEISKRCIEISMVDAQQEGKKVSLTVMGTRKREMEKATRYVGTGHLKHENTFRGWFGYYAFSGIMILVGSIKTLVGGVALLLKSFIPGRQISGDNEHDRRDR